MNAVKGLGEQENGAGGGEAGLSPSLYRLLLEPPYSRHGRPAANSQPPSPSLQSVPAAPAPAGRPRLTRNVGPGPGRGGQAAAPRTPAAPNPKHTRTHTRARRPIRSPGGVGRRFHNVSFILPKARFASHGRLHPTILRGLQGGHLRHGPSPISPRPPSPLHPHL